MWAGKSYKPRTELQGQREASGVGQHPEA